MKKRDGSHAGLLSQVFSAMQTSKNQLQTVNLEWMLQQTSDRLSHSVRGVLMEIIAPKDENKEDTRR